MIQNVFFPLRVLLLTIHYVVFVCLSVLFIASASASCLVLSCRVYFFFFSHSLTVSSLILVKSSHLVFESTDTLLSLHRYLILTHSISPNLLSHSTSFDSYFHSSNDWFFFFILYSRITMTLVLFSSFVNPVYVAHIDCLPACLP